MGITIDQDAGPRGLVRHNRKERTLQRLPRFCLRRQLESGWRSGADVVELGDDAVDGIAHHAEITDSDGVGRLCAQIFQVDKVDVTVEGDGHLAVGAQRANNVLAKFQLNAQNVLKETGLPGRKGISPVRTRRACGFPCCPSARDETG